jgi:hypothetical protein
VRFRKINLQTMTTTTWRHSGMVAMRDKRSTSNKITASLFNVHTTAIPVTEKLLNLNVSANLSQGKGQVKRTVRT